ncbi:SAM-dependent methyltransferase [Azoarcus sp. KH32C]|uniref:SAM-dependent methyltransferase n=1 Tax=Azoarcus sp. KH32C TaxID=748247 RepID=UPI00023862CA|nr:SAM-dependent methyltransferase [Azoarcus sp. KH32C]BAL25158.1 uroporphyrin-III C/tetrapyrrole (Corrin/porphyrin) methyltransferase [Azoarcus sp. KH32C]
MKTACGTLYLLPVSLGDTAWSRFLPLEVQQTAARIRTFVVENAKTARAELKRLEHPAPLRDLQITELPEQDNAATLDSLLTPALGGQDIGLMSEAGCPAVADPGARLVARAHALGIPVRPMVGPSSILLALMASGLNGQSFAFNGYLPVADAERDTRVRKFEEESRRLKRTQIFIETPYRNDRLYDALLSVCQPSTRLCIARDLTTDDEWIRSCTIGEWRKGARPDLHKRPSLFLLLSA